MYKNTEKRKRNHNNQTIWSICVRLRFSVIFVHQYGFLYLLLWLSYVYIVSKNQALSVPSFSRKGNYFC